MEGTEISIRACVPGDLDRILREWLSSFRSSPWAGVIPNNLYRKVYAETIRQLLSRGARIDVACYAEKPEIIVGFICYEMTPRDKILHYAFIRSDYRGNGIARALMNNAGFLPNQPYVYTFRTRESGYFSGGRHMKELACRKEAYKQDPDAGNPQELN
jgi:GNAT superfamily N-acetyltransferase